MESKQIQDYCSLRREALERYFGRMNDMQKRAVFLTDGPLLILAGAGSGKTTVLISRIENMIRFGGAYHSRQLPHGAGERELAVLRSYLSGGPVTPEELAPAVAEDPVRPWNILAITFTNKAAAELRARLEEALGRDAVVIASGDLSHKLTEDGPYGFAAEGPELDKKLTNIMRSGSFGDFLELDSALCERGAECGLASFITMAGILDQKVVDTQFLSYEGPFGVGYAVCAYRVAGDNPDRDFLNQDTVKSRRRIQSLRDNEDAFVRLARNTLESYVTTGKLPPFPKDLPDDLQKERAGVFVSIKKDRQLRGCIGTTKPTQPSLAEEIMHNAVSSGTRAPRFPPVREDELSSLVYNVDVLSPAQPVSDKSMLDALRYGVIVTSGRKRGLLLPNLEGVDTVDEQIHIACQKAGISRNESYTLERFEVVRHT